MHSYEITSFAGGFSDYEDKGIRGSFKYGEGLDIRKRIDSLTAQQALEEESTSGLFTNLALFIVPCSDGATYFFCRGGRIIKRSSGGTYSLVYTDTDGDIRGAYEWYDNTGKTYLFWATATKLHRKEIPGNAAEPWTDVDATGSYPKTNLTSATWHTMKEVNGNMLICNESTFAMVAYDTSYTNNALQLIPGNIAKCLMEKNRYAYIGCDRKDSQEYSGLFLWDTLGLSWNDKVYIQARPINAIIDIGFPLIQVGSDGGIYYADMTNQLPITKFSGGGYVNPDGVTNDDGVALFGVFGSSIQNGVYTYGRKDKNASFVLNLEYPLDCDEIGSVCKSGSNVFVSYKNGSTYGIKKISSTTKQTAIYQSLDLKAPAGLPKGVLPDWKAVQLITSPMPAGSAIELRYKIDKTGNWILSNLEGDANNTQFNTTNGQEALFAVGEIGRYFEMEIKLIPNGNNSPEVLKAEVFFEV